MVWKVIRLCLSLLLIIISNKYGYSSFFVCQFDAGYQLNIMDRDLLINFLKGEASIEELRGKIYNTIIFRVLENFLSREKKLKVFLSL